MTRWCVIACVLASLGGCSALFVRGPGSRQMSCTDFHALPIADTMLAVGSAIAIGAVIRAGSECEGDHCGVEDLLVLPLVPVLLVTVPSALWGYGTVNSCRAYKRGHEDEARAIEALEVEIRRLAAEGKCSELEPLWDELIAREQALNFEHNIEDMTLARCPGVIAPAPTTP